MKRATSPRSTPWLHKEGVVNGVRLHWVEAGNADAPLVVMLHGFPEFWYSWRHQLRDLSKEGFRVAAPDMRGYNLSEKPPSGYDIDTLTKDISEFILLLNRLAKDEEKKPVFLVGHDWGGIVAYSVAARFPHQVRKLVILNAPYLGFLQKESLSWRQWWNFWYIAFFQCPFLPEMMFGSFRSYLLAYGVKQAATVPCFDEATIRTYRDAMSQPKALSSMLEYYRNLRRSCRQTEGHDRIKTPTIILWGTHDTFMEREIFESMDQYVDATLEIIELPCGHWVQQELPEEVTRHLLRYLVD